MKEREFINKATEAITIFKKVLTVNNYRQTESTRKINDYTVEMLF